jgi:dTDP-4-dehydrorhamnose reductase
VETILAAAAKLLDHEDIKIVIIGSGSKLGWMQSEANQKNITNLYFLGRFPPEAMPSILVKASTLLVTLTDKPIFASTVPNKIQAYMAVGRPIIACLNGEGARLVSESGAGLTAKSENLKDFAPSTHKLFHGFDLRHSDTLIELFRICPADVVVNCVGLTKHVVGGRDPLKAIMMNAFLPHRIAELCEISGARLIHVSTDCVFSGEKGNYTEDSPTDSTDIYGRTKSLGEVKKSGCITLRTSTIGHELGTQFGLLEWFITQSKCKGYKEAIFSGIPTIEFARVVGHFVIPNQKLSGIFHVGNKKIDKFSLLKLIAKVYGKKTIVMPDSKIRIDRSLNVEKFYDATGYRAPDWPELVEAMYKENLLGKNAYV